MRSKGMLLQRAVTCITAVRCAVGLNNPGNHMQNGSSSSSVHDVSCACRAFSSMYQEASPFSEGHDLDCHLHMLNGLRPGTSSILKAATRSSMACVMLSCPLRPLSSSTSELRISESNTFIRL